jgi:hypothetical protein
MCLCILENGVSLDKIGPTSGAPQMHQSRIVQTLSVPMDHHIRTTHSYCQGGGSYFHCEYQQKKTSSIHMPQEWTTYPSYNFTKILVVF